ncbi:MAG TPA: arginine deiminase family protein [Blastocatellia bacterium]|nr:arginine deiminase family protein [Blastocatellia bacterium]
MLKAITRQVSPRINECELSFHQRHPIDVAKASAQHRAYQQCLHELGARVISLPAEPDLPDCVFVEDPAVVVDEIAVISIMGAASRRPEADSLAAALADYRDLAFLRKPATLDGGDVMRAGRTLFVGVSGRTNREAVTQLSEILRPFDYQVNPVEVTGCLHLKSACSYIGRNTVLLNRDWINAEELRQFEWIDVPAEEPNAANALLVNDTVVLPLSFPRTRALLERRGLRTQTIDVSELQKAESGVTCMSLIFEDEMN